MKPAAMFFVAASLLLFGCDAPVSQKLISATPATPREFSNARTAASLCGRYAPNWVAASTALKAEGYFETNDARLVAIQKAQRSAILEKSGSDVIVVLGVKGSTSACIVGLKGMTPQQSFELAQPWVQKFDGRTNAERGQGLAKNAVQAWGTIEEERIVYIAAYKTWDILDAPGAAARLLYIQR